VVVGHPAALMHDACWRRLLGFAAARGAFHGAGASALARALRGGGEFFCDRCNCLSAAAALCARPSCFRVCLCAHCVTCLCVPGCRRGTWR
jgi:hypothetical protein